MSFLQIIFIKLYSHLMTKTELKTRLCRRHILIRQYTRFFLYKQLAYKQQYWDFEDFFHRKRKIFAGSKIKLNKSNVLSLTIILNLFGGGRGISKIEKIRVEPKQLQYWPKKQVSYKKISCILYCTVCTVLYVKIYVLLKLYYYNRTNPDENIYTRFRH